MSAQVDRFAWERGLRDERIALKAATVGVLYALAPFLDPSGCGYASQPDLAKASRMSERSVRRHLDLAIAAGVLERVVRGHRRGDDIPLASRYQATLPTEGGPER